MQWLVVGGMFLCGVALIVCEPLIWVLIAAFAR